MVDKQLEKFERWIREMFENRQKSEVCYHNMDHSLQIVKKVAEIGEYYNLSKEEKEDLYVAGWMHDIGYWEGKGEGHEIKGSEMAQKYLIELGLNQERVDRIKSLILATKVPQNPKNLLVEIICDADLFHLSSEGFFEQTLLLKKEKELREELGSRYHRCCSAEEDKGIYSGRVTGFLAEQADLPADLPYYICGQADMAVDTRDLLIARGVPFSHIVTEIYF